MFDRDATVVRELRDAGAVLLGKLAMVEFAGGLGYRYADASIERPGPQSVGPRRAGPAARRRARAPRSRPGSSAFALGTETWGSILCPSAFCGITGLRPTYGRVSRAGAHGVLVHVRQGRPARALGRRLPARSCSAIAGQRSRTIRRRRDEPVDLARRRQSLRAAARARSSRSTSRRAREPEAQRGVRRRAVAELRADRARDRRRRSCPSSRPPRSRARSSPPRRCRRSSASTATARCAKLQRSVRALPVGDQSGDHRRRPGQGVAHAPRAAAEDGGVLRATTT